MQFVNLTSKIVFTSYSGQLRPGQVSADGGPKRRKLEEVLGEIVKACGKSLGIRLNSAEAKLLNDLMTLDEKGVNFDKSQIPPEVRNDPTGEKRAAEAVLAAQRNEAAARDEANRKGAQVEAEINGEIIRKPVGPATLSGEPVKSGDLKSGFEQIIEENARIASEQGEPVPADGGKKDVGEILDPVGVHAKKEGTDAQAANGAENAPVAGADQDDGDGSIGKEPEEIPMAHNRNDDGTRSADANVPPAQAPDKGGKMDKNAAEVAAGLDQLGPVKGKGRGKKGHK